MKKILIFFVVLTLIAMLFLSCSKNEVTTTLDYSEGEFKEFEGYVLLSRPTDQSITCTVIAEKNVNVFVEFTNGQTVNKTREYSVSASEPAVIEIDGLESYKEYRYRLFYREETAPDYYKGKEYNFITSREKGEEFSFCIQSDSHLLNKADKETYQKVMNQISEFNPDLMFDLGDTFLNDSDFDVTYQTVKETYFEQVPYLSTIAQTSPLFLVIGNHEGEYGFYNEGEECLPVYSTLARKMYFKNPEPNEFYSGNEISEEYVGLPQNYYAFTWGDALFVALDPYRYTMLQPYEKGSGSPWDWTLGDEQYAWLKETLEYSDAKYKFVFAHHAIGNMRGGEQVANLYEWGGYDNKGKYLFDEKKPNYDKPIHQMMIDAGVTIFFQGHDHLFAREMVDGIIYQTMPKPAEVIPDTKENSKSYPNADVLLNSGYLNISVKKEHVQVDYNRLVVAGSPNCPDTGVVYSYTIDENSNLTILNSTDDTEEFDNYNNYERSNDNKDKGEKQNQGKGENQSKDTSNNANLELYTDDLLIGKPIVGRPTDTSISISTMLPEDCTYYYLYGSNADNLDNKTQEKTVSFAEIVVEQLIDLSPSRTYYYKLCYIVDSKIIESETYSFKTQKSESENFTFLVQADPHLDESSDIEQYHQTLSNMSEIDADFLVDLGDASMAEKLADTNEEIVARNILLRTCWDDIASSVPIFMTIGNHDGENGWSDSTFARTTRRSYFLNPEPNSFYSGLSDTVYAWEWGDCQFIVLDPYAYVDKKPKDDLWGWTLGAEQYNWLKNVLRESDANYKFIFIHNLVGGIDKDSRGGISIADNYEWGGYNKEGIYEFDQMRADFEMPIHELLNQYDVDIVFHGHDHFYAKEELDGIIYQLVPQPSLLMEQNVENILEDYGYTDGTYFPTPGYLRIDVAKESATITLIESRGNTIQYIYEID